MKPAAIDVAFASRGGSAATIAEAGLFTRIVLTGDAALLADRAMAGRQPRGPFEQFP